MNILNLGILAHVDAGKTTLTERLLYSAGVIAEIGSVDAGSTQTDTMELERQRGITIKSAVVSFEINDVTVNLIDTPGHPDFIAEVERVLSVLDGAVLVISAVEGVQPQTRVLMRTLQRLRIPTIIFVNKLDRAGAQYEGVLERIAARLTPAIIAMGAADGLGTREPSFTPFGASDTAFTSRLAELLAEHDDDLLAAYIDDPDSLTYDRLRAELAAQTGQARVHPVFFGSAITGAGVDVLIDGVTELLPTAAGDVEGPVSGAVFKVERGRAGEKLAYVRMFSGTVRTRDRLPLRDDTEGKVTAISLFEHGAAVQRAAVSAGQIGKLAGLGEIQIGDAIGVAGPSTARQHFAPPTLETVVVPYRASEKGALQVALTQLAEQDPLINLRQDDVRQELFVSLYGEVQKEVIQSTLASDYSLDVTFRETTTICIERPAGIGEAIDILNAESNPFLATIGLRIEPAPHDTGIEFRLDVPSQSVPLFVYKNVESFAAMMEQYVRDTLREGIYGWQVTDCIVTMTDCVYSSWDGPPSQRGPLSTAADFRKLTPLVMMGALARAGSTVCEPFHHYELEIPIDALGAVLPVLSRLAAIPHAPAARGSAYVLEGEIPAALVHELRQQLPALTRGEGVLETTFEGYLPVQGAIPTRPRTDNNPLNRKEYLLHVLRRT